MIFMFINSKHYQKVKERKKEEKFFHGVLQRTVKLKLKNYFKIYSENMNNNNEIVICT